jgi:hypothetical protein
VPIDVARDAWVDDRCPLDDCGDLGIKKSFKILRT